MTPSRNFLSTLVLSLLVAGSIGCTTDEGGGGAAYCSETEPWPSGYTLCLRDSDCMFSGGDCRPDGPSPGCGMCQEVGNRCEDDSGCPDGSVCVAYKPQVSCYCGGLALRCEEGCATAGCGDGYTCADDGRCEEISCADGYTCPVNTVCGSNLNDHGCTRLPCKSSADCECGACFFGECADRPGVCVVSGPDVP